MLQINGNHNNIGGGQIVRTALALSVLTQTPFEVSDIRQGRPKPGLKAQHLNCINALQQLCNAEVEGDELGSEYLKFTPHEITNNTINVDIGTAGSISLLLQSLLVPCIFTPGEKRIKIIGGTSGKWAMPYDFFENVLVPQISKYCNKIDVELIRRGYFPKGGGKVDIKITPFEEKDDGEINLTSNGDLMWINGISHSSNFLEKQEVAERTAKEAKRLLSELGVPVNIKTEYCDTLCPGSGITLWAEFRGETILGADALGERGKKSEQVGREAAEKLLQEINSEACVDEHTADNLIPFLGIVGGKIKTSKITDHIKTNIYVTEQFLDKKFKIEGNEISC
ncbi:RNA 3'-terminal phosphate cyclase [Nanoarchaeota archaeon]